jgi:hypothetical protein
MADDLVQSFFGKSIRQLTKHDLINFFSTERQETNNIEFKAYVDEQVPGTTKESRDFKKLNEIITTISAFLNSDGGVLIWGAPKGIKPAGRKERTYQGELKTVDLLLEQERFINMIASSISPMPLRVNFQPVDMDGGKYCYVVEVARSEFGPHQHKGTYYMRMDGSTRTAPHHFVEALMKKITFPRIEVYLHLGDLHELISNFAIIPIQLTVHNLSRYQTEKNIQIRLMCDRGDIIPASSQSTPVLQYSSDLSDRIEILHYRNAHHENYFLVLDRFHIRYYKLRITVSVSGDTSPVINSWQFIEISHHGANLIYKTIEKVENIYLADMAKEDQSDKEIIENTNDQLFEHMKKNFHLSPLFRHLTGWLRS